MGSGWCVFDITNGLSLSGMLSGGEYLTMWSGGKNNSSLSGKSPIINVTNVKICLNSII